MLCVLKGAYRFFTILVNELFNSRCKFSTTLSIEFIRVKSYENTSSTDNIEITGLSDLNELIGKNILVNILTFTNLFLDC